MPNLGPVRWRGFGSFGLPNAVFQAPSEIASMRRLALHGWPPLPRAQRMANYFRDRAAAVYRGGREKAALGGGGGRLPDTLSTGWQSHWPARPVIGAVTSEALL